MNVPNARLAKGRDTELLVQKFYVRKLVPNIRDLQIIYRNNYASIPLRKWHTRRTFGQFCDTTNLFLKRPYNVEPRAGHDSETNPWTFPVPVLWILIWDRRNCVSRPVHLSNGGLRARGVKGKKGTQDAQNVLDGLQ
jgi:hypothetical protein